MSHKNPDGGKTRAALEAAAITGCTPHAIWRLCTDTHTLTPGDMLASAIPNACKPGIWHGWKKTDAAETWKKLAEWTTGLETAAPCAGIAANKPGGPATPEELARLVRLAGGGDPAPGLDKLSGRMSRDST